MASLAGVEADEPVPADPDLPCVLLYTSGTTSAPKAAVLRHRHLMAYLLGTVEFGNAGEDEAALVCVPPYHVAGLMNLLSNLYAGRRIVYLEGFDAETWLATVREQRVTQAMVIPTMLARIVDALAEAPDAGTPTLRSLSYGGSRMPTPVLRRALELFGDTGFVNAYGLTETSSTIALLGPEDHRAAFSSDDEAVRRRLGSVGQVLPGIEVEVRDEAGAVLGVGHPGLVFLRGEQISGSTPGPPCSTTKAGSPLGTAGSSTRTVTCTSRDGPTTPSSGVGRTSPRPRSRTSCSTTPRSPTPWWSGCPTRNGDNDWSPWWSPSPGRRWMPAASRSWSASTCGRPRPPTPSSSGPSSPDRHRQAVTAQGGRATHPLTP